MQHQQTAESLGAAAVKLSPPATVATASVAGMPISELVLWATLVYTVLMICHKAIVIYREFKDGRSK